MNERHMPYIFATVLVAGVLALWVMLSAEPATIPARPTNPPVGVHISAVYADLGEPMKVLNYKNGKRGETFQFEELWEVEAAGSVQQPHERNDSILVRHESCRGAYQSRAGSNSSWMTQGWCSTPIRKNGGTRPVCPFEKCRRRTR